MNKQLSQNCLWGGACIPSSMDGQFIEHLILFVFLSCYLFNYLLVFTETFLVHSVQLLYLRPRIVINLSTGCVSHVLLLPVVVVAAEAAEAKAWHHFRGEKFTAQWRPVSLQLPLPGRISCLLSLLYWFSCLKLSYSQGQYNGCNLM